MAREACKIIINNGLRALTIALEQILTTMDLKSRLPEEKRYELIQRLADVDIAAYTGGGMPVDGLLGIMNELQSFGILSDDVWKIYATTASGRKKS